MPLKLPQVAKRLGLSEAGVRHHVYKTKRLKPLTDKGDDLLFAEAEVERFSVNRRSPGRKPKKGAALSTDERLRQIAALRAEGYKLDRLAKEWGYSDATSLSRALSRWKKKQSAN